MSLRVCQQLDEFSSLRDTELRIKLYLRTIGEEWVTALVLVGIWLALGRSGAAIGLVPQQGQLESARK